MLNTVGHVLSFLMPSISTSYKALVLYCHILIRGIKHYERAEQKKKKKKVGNPVVHSVK